MIVQFKVSESEKAVDVLFDPLVEYFTYNVSGSVPSATATSITFATSPEVAPVKVTPL